MYNARGVYSIFNRDLTFDATTHKWLGRVDLQATSATRFNFRFSGYDSLFYAGGGATSHPINMGERGRVASQYNGAMTSVIGGTSVNEIKAGMTLYERLDQSTTATWKARSSLPGWRSTLARST